MESKPSQSAAKKAKAKDAERKRKRRESLFERPRGLMVVTEEGGKRKEGRKWRIDDRREEGKRKKMKEKQ